MLLALPFLDDVPLKVCYNMFYPLTEDAGLGILMRL